MNSWVISFKKDEKKLAGLFILNFLFFFSNIHSQTSLPVPVIRKEEYILKRFFKVISLEQNVKLNF